MKKLKAVQINCIIFLMILGGSPIATHASQKVTVQLCDRNLFELSSTVRLQMIFNKDTVEAIKNDSGSFYFLIDESKINDTAYYPVIIEDKEHRLITEMSLPAMCKRYNYNVNICLKKNHRKGYQLSVEYCNGIGSVSLLSKKQICKKCKR